jgi:acyl transferase domain-containing protein
MMSNMEPSLNTESCSKREVPAMDPQQRLIVEAAYETLVCADMAKEKILGSQTGVYGVI